MTTDNLTLMKGMIQKIGWLEERQKVLAQNIANADTPGYRPQDITPLDFKELLGKADKKLSLGASTSLKSPQLAATSSTHMGLNGSTNIDPNVDVKKQKNTYETAPAGNAVVLEEQLLKMGENFADHRMITNLYQKNVDMLRLAVRGQ